MTVDTKNVSDAASEVVITDPNSRTSVDISDAKSEDATLTCNKEKPCDQSSEKGGSNDDVKSEETSKLVDDAPKFLNDKVTKAVVTVPTNFNDSQRTATKGVGCLARLRVLRSVNEPTACGFKEKEDETIMVFDPGGGTFDVSVPEVGDGVFEVLFTSRDTHLGGDDFHKRIVDFLAADFKRSEGIDLLKDKHDDPDLRINPSQEEGDDAIPVGS
ncbi:hypothetical protein Droror1_Dr00002554 [Drosera rotundifolia]